MKDEIDRLAGEINSTYGKPGWQPLHYQFRGVKPKDLIAMYRHAAVAFVTPLRDGLNLVAKVLSCHFLIGSNVAFWDSTWVSHI